MVIVHIKVADEEPGGSIIKVDIDSVMFDGNHPKYVVAVNMDVVIMDLLSECGRSNRTGVHVDSNEGERGSMFVTPYVDDSALAEAHVGLKCQPRSGTRCRVCSGSASADVG